MSAMMLAGCALLAGCDRQDAAPGNAAAGADGVPVPTAPVPPPAAVITDKWIGRWIGVEGLSLQVAAGTRPGLYRLHITTMDGQGDYAGEAKGGTIAFTRDGTAETIRHSDGAGTGLKWLDGKTDCLTIKPGEGFCRDRPVGGRGR